jgi:putative transcriptional regulator
MESPLRGKVLIASPQLSDSTFARSVVLIVQHSEKGAMGLVINRALETTVGEAWKQVSSIPYPNDDPLFQGGPVDGPLIVLHKDEARGQMQVQDDIWLSSEADAVKSLVSDGVEPMKFFVGYAGWDPMQLERELAEGSWEVAEIDSSHVLATPPEIWEGLQTHSRRLSRPSTRPAIDPKRIPPDPSVN